MSQSGAITCQRPECANLAQPGTNAYDTVGNRRVKNQIQLCYPTALHPEGIYMLNSVTAVISKIKTEITPRLETFYHPEIDDSHRDFLNFPRNRRSLSDALESGRHVTCCVKNEAQGF